MKILRRHRRFLNSLLALLVFIWQMGQPLQAATLSWTGATNTNWSDAGNWSGGVPTAGDDAVFGSTIPGTGSIITLGAGSLANSLRFNNNYTLNGGQLALGTGGIRVDFGRLVHVNSQLNGTDGLLLSGGGAVRLASGNTYTGTTTIANGALIITNPSALGSDTSTILVTGFNPAITSTTLRGFGGGSLVLDGTGGDINLTRNLSLQGYGPFSDRSGSLISTGVNTLSGEVTMGTDYNGTFLSTRAIAADGTLDLTGKFNVLGTAGTTVSNLGGVNQAGASFYNVTGTLAGTGTLESSGGGTLFLNPTDASGFSGVIRVSGSAASGQSVVRIDSPNVLGTRTATTTSSVLDMNGGVLAILMDSPSVLAGGAAANVYGRAGSTFFADHTPNSSVKDQTVTFGQFAFEENQTFTFNSRNGYGMTFGAAPVQGGNNNTTLTNNLQGGAQLTFVGNFWSNTDNGAARTMTIGGNGNTTINGNILATSTTFDHVLSKSGTGTLTLLGTASTLDGAVSISGGTVAISDWRAITNNGSAINLNGGTLSVIGNNVNQTNLTTSKVINLSGTTGAATILANQTGTSPGVILNANFTATGAGTKTLTLGGTNTAANTINGSIVQNGTTNLVKIDAGTWVLAGVNAYTGTTTISNGILRAKANAATSTVIADTSNLVFNATNVYAGGSFEFLGQASANNVETVGSLVPTNGSGTIKLTPGSGGTASLVFASLGTVGGGGSVNIVAPTSGDSVTFTTVPAANNIPNAGFYYNGSNFAFTTAAGLVRAPVYGTDADFSTSATSLTAAASNEVTGSFTTSGALAIDSLKISGSQTLTLAGNLTIRTAAGASNSGGILQTGGSGTITGAFSIGTNNAAATVIRVDGATDVLSLESTLFGTGGITKTGEGMLRLLGANIQTGTISINTGTVRLVDTGRLGAANAALVIRQDGVLELNGVTPATATGAYSNNGVIRNTSATPVVFTVGGNNGAGGNSLGIIEDGGAGSVSVVKVGTGAQGWLGLSTYTGTTTIGSTGIISINNLQNGGQSSGIGASSNAADNLIFNGTSTSQAYGGISYTGTTNDETDRLFTFDGGASGGARIQSNGINGATSSWTNVGALAFGPNATGNPQGLVLGGGSTGDNRFFPLITDNGSAATSVYKADAGVWYLMGTNTYSGVTELRGGALYVVDGVTLPTPSNLVFNGGVLATTGTFNRTIGTSASQMSFAAPANTGSFRGGFAAGGSKLTVDWGDGHVWGSTASFLGARDGLIFGAANGQTPVTKSNVELVNDFSLGTASISDASGLSYTLANSSSTVTVNSTAGYTVGQAFTGTNVPAGAYIVSINSATTFSLSANTGSTASGSYTNGATFGGSLRPIRVDDNTSIGADFATLSGDISGGAGTGIRKLGAGILVLSGNNTYNGETNVFQGTLVVSSLGNSTGSGATSVGTEVNAAADSNAVTLGNGGTGAGILEYVGAGETSDRKIRLNTTTGSTQIHADGVGPLILTNVANDMTGGAKTLILRGVSATNNMITSDLYDNNGTLGITVDGSTAWTLAGDNSAMSGVVSVNAGALGVGSNNAMGTGLISFNNGNFFAFGADRILTNPIDQDNNTTMAFLGDYSLTFVNPLVSTAGANSFGTNNNIAAGKTLTFGGATVNDITGDRTWTIDGSGTTIIDGNITTDETANRGLTLLKTGNGVLVLNGTGSNFNRNARSIDIDRGTLRLGASGVIPDGFDDQTVPVAYGGITLTPELANGDTATFDLNGYSETVNGITMNTDGTAIIDNTSATAVTLTFGAADQTASIGGGTGTYIVRNTGGGALSLVKTGTAAATIPTGVTLSYTGATTVNGGSFTIASQVNGTTALSATNGTTLALTGGIANASAITSVVVDNGSTLSLLDGAGNKLNSLSNLQLGSSGGAMTYLNLNVGDQTSTGDELFTDTLTLQTGGLLSLFLGNKVTLNLTDIGLNPGETYDLISVADGGLTSGVLGASDWILGATPGGFDSISLLVSNNLIRLQTGNLVPGSWYWGAAGTLDNWGDAANWLDAKSTGSTRVSAPGQASDVIFVADDLTGGAAVTTTLEQNFKIRSLTFEASTNPGNTPASVTIDPGAVSTSRLEITPVSSLVGIAINAGGPANVTISGPVKIGASQTWNVADAGAVLSLGSLQGEADVTKAGSGKVILTGAADPTFNSGVTSDIIINAGTLEIRDVSALGNPVNSNLANVSVNSTGAFFYNGVASTTTNLAMPITLNGGTLSAGTANQTYSGTVNVSGNSFINMAENNGPATNTARNITLSGVVSGSGSLTIDSNNTASGGNQLTGTLTINNPSSSWNGDLYFNRGTVTISSTASASVAPNNVTFNSFGRIIYGGVDGQTINRAGTLNYAAGAYGEFQVDNVTTTQTLGFQVNQNGAVTLGDGGLGANLRVALVDALAYLDIKGAVTLGGPSSISVSNSSTRLLIISGNIGEMESGYSLAINDDAGGWAQTNGTVRLTGQNTFSGNLTIDSGILEFTTVTDAAGGASSLGNGSAISTINAVNLRFIGPTDQSTDRPITSTTGVLTLSANGSGTITYNGAITVGPTADGSQIVLTGVAGSQGVIGGGITQTGDAADASISGGTWTHQAGSSRIGDDLTLSGANTILKVDGGTIQVRDDFTVTTDATLYLNDAGVLSFDVATLSADASLRATTGGTIVINAEGAVNSTQFDGLRIGVDAAGLGTLVLNANQTVTEFILGNRTLDREGLVTGTGTLTVTGNLDVYEGIIHANLASSGTTSFEKIGSETVTLRGDNSGLDSTGSSIVYGGTLALDYTVSNTTKLRAASALDLRGGTLQIIGNAGAATSQTVGGLTLASGGYSTILINPGSGQDAVINLGQITRGNGASDGTIRFNLPAGAQTATHGVNTTSPNSTFGLLGTGGSSTADAAYATVEDAFGTWFATNSGGNVVALGSTAKDDIATWALGEHITDDTGFTGSLQAARINSLRFNASSGSDLVIGSGIDFVIGSGGVLVTSNVGGTPSIMGGDLVSGVNEIVVTQDSQQTFLIGSNIGGSHAVTKSGTGTLLLTGYNTYTDETEIHAGTLQVGGGNAIGDNSPVNLAIYEDSTLQLLADETIGRLSGGQRQGDDDHGLVDVGDNTLTINHSGANTTYAGFFSGTGAIVKRGTHNLNMTNVSTGFTGIVTVDSGLFQLSNVGQINASGIRVSKGGALLVDNNGATRSGTRILDTTTVTLDSADGTYNGSTIVRGLAIRIDQNAQTNETIGVLNFGSGANYLSGEASVGTGSAIAQILADDFVRLNNATVAVRGRNLGNATGTRNAFRIGTSANEAAFIANLTGGSGAAGSKNISIVPWAISTATTGALADTDMGNSFATYNSGLGLRPLNLTTEYNTYALGAVTDNIRESLVANLTGLTGKTMNALVIHNGSTAASAINVSGAGAGQALTNTTGAFLFTLNTAAAASSAHSTNLGGFDAGIVSSSGEYIFHVVNPSSAANTATQAVTVSSSLISSADITKSGRGRLVLTTVNTAGGGSNKTTINEGELEIADLDNIGGNTGRLVFAGGTLRLGSTYSGDDFSTRTISILTGGGTLDTNGNNVTLNNGIGSGAGQFAKAGNGTLTLAGTTASNHTGLFLVTRGTLELAQTGGTAIGPGGLSIVSSLNPTTVLFSQSNQIADGASVNVESVSSNGALLNLNGNTETIGSLTITGTTANGSMVQTGSGGVLTVTGDILLINNRAAAGNTGREVLITGTGTYGLAAPDTGTLNLGGVARTITVTRTTGTNPGMDATIETIITNGGIIKEGSQRLILTGTNTYEGDTVINEGTLSISQASSLGADTSGNTLALRNGAVLQSTGAYVILSANRDLELNGIGGTIEVVGGDSNVLVMEGVLTGHGSAPLAKAGGGVLALAGVNTYSGGTLVSEGTLYAANTTGSATGSGAVTVASGATLAGNGILAPAANNSITVDGSVWVGGINDAARQLTLTTTGTGLTTVNGVVAFDLFGGQGSGTLNAQSGNNDQLVVGGSSGFTIGATSTLQVSTSLPIDSNWAVGTEWKLFDWSGLSGGVTGTFSNLSDPAPFNYVNLPDLSSIGLAWDVSNLYSAGTIMVVVPEPGRMLLVFLGLLGLGFRRRR